MDILWAPWRMDYIAEDVTAAQQRETLRHVTVPDDGDPGCFLCQAVHDTEHDRERSVVRRTELTLSVLNRYPYNNGHLLVAPKRHCGELDMISREEKGELTEEIDRWVRVLKAMMNPDGFNLGLNLGQVAGAGLPGHLHWHIVPRWSGDTNFMTSIGSTKVIPQSLEALWKLLVDVEKQQ